MDEKIKLQPTALPDLTLEERGPWPTARVPSMRKVLGVCFLLPAFMMALVYLCLLLWPLGETSVLVLDLNAQYVYYFEKLRNVLVSGDSLTYAFERALGGEFMGIFAYYLSSPLSILVALLPKAWMTESLFFLLIIKTGLCGASFGYYLMKTRQPRAVWTVMFSSMYAMSAYVVVMQHNIMWIDNVFLFPIILLGMDALIREGRFRLYVGALSLAILSNFYIGYMTCLFLAVYFFIRYATMTEDERGTWGRSRFWKALARMLGASLLAVAMTAVIIWPVYYSLSFGKLDFSTPNWEPRQLFDWLEMLTKVFFGSYDSVRPSGMPFLYCGMLVPVLVPLYFAAPGIRLRHKVGNLMAVAFVLFGCNLSTLDVIWHGLQRPNWLNARFAFMFTFFAVLMAFDSFSKLKETGVKKVLFSCGLSAALLLLMQTMDYDNVQDFLTVWGGLAFLCGFGALIPFALREKKPEDELYLYSNPELFLVMFVVFELIANGVAMAYCLDGDVSFSNRTGYRDFVDRFSEASAVMEEIDEEAYGADSLYRAEKIKHRKKNDNFAIDINGLSNSTSTLNAKSITFLKNMGISARSHWSMYYGGNPVTDSLLGLRYVMADKGTESAMPDYMEEFYSLVGTTGEEIEIWENPFNLGIAYATNEAILTYAEYNEDADKELEENGLPTIRDTYENAVEFKTPFQMMNHMVSAMLGREVEIFTKVDSRESDTQGVEPLFVTGHTGYEEDGSGLTAKVVFEMDIDQDLPVYLYFPSEYPRDAEIKLDKNRIGTFFEDDTFCITPLGVLEEGEHEFSVYLEEEKIYFASGCTYFWYFHEDVFREAMAELQAGSADTRSQKDDVVTATVTMPEDKTVLFTTIPYDAGWQAWVDGEKVEIVCLMDTLVGVPASPGEHEIVLKYRPDCVVYGLVISLFAVALYIALSLWDIRRREFGDVSVQWIFGQMKPSLQEQLAQLKVRTKEPELAEPMDLPDEVGEDSLQ